MKKIITIEIDLTSRTGDPMQLDYKMDEIVECIKSTIERERFDEDNKIVYNDWEDPHVCELSIFMKVEE